jgi:hypothetical protein
MTRAAIEVPVDIGETKLYDTAHSLRAEVLAHIDASTAALAALRRLWTPPS